nr:glycine cleavage system aminomethyltransferase GcvT [Afifella marina]
MRSKSVAGGRVATDISDLKRTPLFELHQELGGRIVPFAGYAMPVQYDGIIGEHHWTRDRAGLFDVSHMGQRILKGPHHETTAKALERLTPGDFQGLKPGRQRYTFLLLDNGGIVDDFMAARLAGEEDEGRLFMVFNASRKEIDDDYVRERLPDGVTLEAVEDRALLALQGPAAAEVLSGLCSEVADLTFMQAARAEIRLGDGRSAKVHLSRSGYTGEDGFEISVAADEAEALARAFLAHEAVKPIGLGARDSLRLEAGLPLYGHDIDETTSPVEAGLRFAIAKARRERGDFPGAGRILAELSDGPSRRLVGLKPSGRAPVREGAQILGASDAVIGEVTSGGFGPTVGGPVAMGYVDRAYADPGTELHLAGRRGAEPAEVVPLPFVPHCYHRPKSGAKQ